MKPKAKDCERIIRIALRQPRRRSSRSGAVIDTEPMTMAKGHQRSVIDAMQNIYLEPINLSPYPTTSDSRGA